MSQSLNGEIINELTKGIERLSPQPWNAARALASVFSREAQKRGADMHLLGIIGSWGDTLEDEEVLQLAKEFNSYLSTLEQ